MTTFFKELKNFDKLIRELLDTNKTILEKLESIENRLNNIEVSNKKLIDIKEATTLLSLSRKTILKLIHNGELPAKRIAGKWLIDVTCLKSNNDLDEFVRSVL